MVTRTRLSFAWAASIACLIAVGASGGCYKPNIKDGGLRCTDAGVCPDGFFCSADGTCKKGAAPKCQASAPHIAPICTPAPPGDDCDPVCQSRCDCGRCSLVGTKLSCVPVGTKKRGQFCDPGLDDCEPGNVCMWDCDNSVGRCFRFCGRGGVQDDGICKGQLCNVPVTDADGGATDLWVCPPPPQVCNPIDDSGECQNAALGCYFDDTINSTVCDCKGKGAPNGACSVFNSCVAGYRCVTLNAATGPQCLKICTLNPSDCPSGICQPAGGGNFGYCPP